MSDYKGNFADGATVRATFNSFATGGESVTITTLLATDVWIYRDGVIQSTVGAGVTVDIDVGSAGSHRISVDTSDTTDLNFYEPGHDYEIKIDGATIDTKIVNPFTAEFSIENRFMRGTDSAALASVLGAAVGASISADIADLPTVAEFEARTLVSAAYVVVGDTIAGVTTAGTVTDGAKSAKQDTMETTLDDVPSTAEFNARTLLAAAYVIVSDTIAGVTTAGTVTDGAKSATVALEATLTSMKGATFATGTDSLEAIRNRGDAAWTSATGFATEAKQDAGDVVRDRITDIQEADRTIDFTAGTLIYETKGTATVLLTKNLKDPAGAAVNSTEDVIAAEENV